MSKVGQASASSLASSSQPATPSIHPADLHPDVLSRSVTAATPSRAGSVIETLPVPAATNGTTTSTPAAESVNVKVEADASTSGQTNPQNANGAQMNGNPSSSAPPKKRLVPNPNIDKVVNEARRRSRLKGRGYYDEQATIQSAARYVSFVLPLILYALAPFSNIQFYSCIWCIYNRVAVSLASDQNSALNPDIDTPFRNSTDVIQRLLPYHVFQHPAEDLATLCRGSNAKGKRKATEEDLLREEIAGEDHSSRVSWVYALTI